MADKKADRPDRRRPHPDAVDAEAAGRRGRALSRARRMHQPHLGRDGRARRARRASIGASTLKPTLPGKLICGPALTVRNITQRVDPFAGAEEERQRHGRVRGAQSGRGRRRAGDLGRLRHVEHGRHLGAHRPAPGRARRDRDGRRARRARIRARSAIRSGRARSRRSPASGGSRRSRSTARSRWATCGSTPGDLVVADDTGVVFIPRDRIMAVLELCEKKKQGEDTRIDAISHGVPVPVFYGKGYGEQAITPSAWMFAALPTSSHFLISARTKAAKSAGLLAIGSAPSPASTPVGLGIGEHRGGLGVQAVDDRLRRAGGREQAEPVQHLVVLDAGLRHGRHVRQRRRALQRRDGERAELAGVDVRLGRRQCSRPST